MTTISAVNFLTETGSAAFNAGRRALLTHYWPSEASNDRGVWNTRFNAMLPPALQIAADSRPAQFRPAYNLLNSTALWVAGYAFAAAQAGGLWQGTVASSLFSDTGGTIAATLGGQVARVNDRTGNGINLTQANASLRPLRGRRPRTGVRNGLIWSEDLTNAAWSRALITTPEPDFIRPNSGASLVDAQITSPVVSKPSAALPYTLSFTALDAGFNRVLLLLFGQNIATHRALVTLNIGDGSIAVAATSAGGFVINSVSSEPDPLGGRRFRVFFTTEAGFTCGVRYYAADSVATTGNGTSGIRIRRSQIEPGHVTAPVYQRVNAASDVTEAGVPDVPVLLFDLVDDALPSPPIATGVTGQAFVAGDGGCYVTDLSVAPAGTFRLGGASLHEWTGAPNGALLAVSNNTGRVLDAIIRAGTFTEAEIAALERFYVALGGRTLLVPDGPNLWTGTPNRVDPECTVTADDAVSFNTTTTRLVGWTSASPKLDLGAWYLASMNLTRTSGTFVTPYTGSGADLLNTTTAGVNTRIFRASARELYVGTNGAAVGAMSAISVRRLVNRSL